MERRQTWALGLGVALLAAAELLAPLLGFRLGLVAAGVDLGYLLAAGLPAAAALGAVWVGPLTPSATPQRVARRAAALAFGAAIAWLVGLLLLTWLAQRLGTPPHEAPPSLRLGVVATWLLSAASGGAALALGLRLGATRIGRFGFVEATGAAAACLTVPAVLLVGAPRAALLVTLLPAVAAFAFIELCRGATPGDSRLGNQPSRAVLVTVPLVVAALLAGDLGDPWLHIPNDGGKRSPTALQIWTAGGLVAVNKPTARTFGYSVDGGELIPLASARAASAKPPAGLLDLAFALDTKGPALVIGSGGGREVQAALGHGLEPVSALELEPAVLKEVALGRFAEETGRFYAPSSRLQTSLGDGRAGLRRLPHDYGTILVVAAEPWVQAPPRLLGWERRLYTQTALHAYLDHLAPDGLLVLRCAAGEIGSLWAVAQSVLGSDARRASQHMFACGAKEGAVLLVRAGVLNGPDRTRLTKFCRKRKLEVHDPGAIGRGPADDVAAGHKAEPDAEGSTDEAQLPEPVAPWATTVATDDRPFLDGAPPLGVLGKLAIASLREALSLRKAPSEAPAPIASDLLPTEPPIGSGQLKGEPATKAPRAPKPKTEPAHEPPGPVATVAAGGLCTAVLLVLCLLAPRPRRRGPGAAPRALCFAVAPLGVGLGMAELGTADQLLGMLGHPAYAWPLVIPLGLVGAAAGRLWVDTLSRPRLGPALEVVAGLGVVLTLSVFASAARILTMAGGPIVLGVAVCAVLMLALGMSFGAPLAAILRLAAQNGETEAAPNGPLVAWCWGVHLGGWAFGTAAGALLARYLGVQSLLLIGALGLVSAAVLAGLARKPGLPLAAAEPLARTSQVGAQVEQP